MSGHPADRNAASTSGADPVRLPVPDRGHRRASILLLSTLVTMLLLLVGGSPSSAVPGTPCPDPGCSVAIDAQDFATQTSLTDFSFVVNLDNTKLASDPLSLI